MDSAKSAAHELRRLLAAHDVAATLREEGTYFVVEAAGPSGRDAQIVCFWYETIVGLIVGMNPANSRTSPRRQASHYVGPEWFAVA